MKIAIMSDSHEHWDNLRRAIAIANTSCDILLFAGDLMAPGNGLGALKTFHGPVHMVFGNNDGDIYKLTKNSQGTNITIHGDIYEDTIDDLKVMMNHYPKIVTRAAKSGDYDVCIYGHDHKYHYSTIGNTQLINPGSIVWDDEAAWFVIYDTQTKEVEHIIL
jgi:putative phosphoesterase